MEVNALTRWNSLGSELFKLGELDDAILRILTNRSLEQDNNNWAEWMQHFRIRDESPWRQEFPEFGFICHDVERASSPPGREHDAAPKPATGDRMIRFLKRFIRLFMKGFVVGAGGQGVFTAAKMMLRRSKQQSGSRRLTDMALPDVARFGAFVGVFTSLFECGMLASNLLPMQSNARQMCRPRARSNSVVWAYADPSDSVWKRCLPFVVGGISGLALLLAPVHTRTPIALFFGVRAFEIACRLAVAWGYAPRIQNADVALMALASSQVLFAWFYYPRSLDSGYRHFLDHQGGRAAGVVPAFAHWLDRSEIPPTTLSILNAQRVENSYSVIDIDSVCNGCDILHPQTSCCSLAVVQFFLQALRRALPVYVPVYLLPLLLFKSSKLLTDPVKLGTHTLWGILRSSSFLASYCSMAWLVACWGRPLLGRGRALVALAGLGAGLTVLAEKKPRRIELGLFVFTHALQSMYRIMKAREILRPIKDGEVALFSGAAAVIMYCYVREPPNMRPGYYSLLRWMFCSSRQGLQTDVASTHIDSSCERNRGSSLTDHS